MGHFKFNRVHCILLIWSLSLNYGYAQNNTAFRAIEALESEFVSGDHEIDQDKTGNLWVLSKDKIVKFNSVSAARYDKFSGFEAKQISFQKILVDGKDRVWVGTSESLALYDEISDRFKVINVGMDSIQVLAEDSESHLWIATNNGIFKAIENKDASFSIKKIVSGTFSPTSLAFVGNKILIGTKDGLYALNRNNRNLQEIKTSWYQNLHISQISVLDDLILLGTPDTGLFKSDLSFSKFEKVYGLPYTTTNTAVTGIETDDTSNFYVSFDGGGLLKLSKEMEVLENLDKQSQSKNFPGSSLREIHLGHDNLLWISNKNGQIGYLNLAGNAIQHLVNDPQKYSSLSHNNITAIEKDSNGNIWFGNGNGISIWYPSSNAWTHIKNLSFRFQFKDPDIIKDLESDGEHMWVATYNDGVYKINIGTFLRAQYAPDASVKTEIKNANTVYVDSFGGIWIGRDNGDLSVIKPNGDIKTYAISNVNVISGTKSGLIIAAGKNGVTKINPRNGKVEPVKALLPNKKQLSYLNINSITQNDNNDLVIATQGAGLVLYNLKNNKLEVLSTASGLLTNDIQSVIYSENSGYWLGTNNGLVNLQREGEKDAIRIYGKDDGFLTNSFNPKSLAQIDNNTFAIGSSNGVSVFKPILLQEHEPSFPQIVFQDLKIINKSESDKNSRFLVPKADEKIDLEKNQNSFVLDFIGVSQVNPANVKYSWKLEGLDKDWSLPTNQHRVNYTNLLPGNYTFKLKATNGNGLWSPVKQLSLALSAPWWGGDMAFLWVGISVLLLLTLALVVFMYISREKRIKAQKEFFNHLHHEIKTPLTILLNSLENMAREGDKEFESRIRNTVIRINALFEQILNFQNITSSKFLVQDISKIQLEAHIEELVDDFDPVLKEKQLEVIVNDQWSGKPFYFDLSNFDKIFFNLLSNSIRYCFEGGKIIINLLEITKGDLKIQIADNGTGIPKHHQKLLHKKNISDKKLAKNVGNNAVLSILKAKGLIEKTGGSLLFESVKNEGTTFTFILKNQQKEFLQPEADKPKLEEVVEEKLIAEPVKPLEIQEFSGSKILVVEPDIQLREALVTNIGRYCQVYESGNAMEALEKANQIFPDILITELDMEEMDGIALNKALKKDIGLNHISTFLMAMFQSSSQKEKYEDLGISEIINKPVDINQLLSKISSVLNWHKELREKYLNAELDEERIVYRNTTDEKFISNLKEIILQHIQSESFTVHDLSNKMGLSSNALYMKLKNLVDLSPQDFITLTKLTYANRLLKKGELNVMEVSYKSGFSSPKVFFSVYEKYYGYTPSESLEKI